MAGNILSAQALFAGLATGASAAQAKGKSSKACQPTGKAGKFADVLKTAMGPAAGNSGKVAAKKGFAFISKDDKSNLAGKLGISVKQLDQLLLAIGKLGKKKIKGLAAGDKAAESLLDKLLALLEQVLQEVTAPQTAGSESSENKEKDKGPEELKDLLAGLVRHLQEQQAGETGEPVEGNDNAAAADEIKAILHELVSELESQPAEKALKPFFDKLKTALDEKGLHLDDLSKTALQENIKEGKNNLFPEEEIQADGIKVAKEDNSESKEPTGKHTDNESSAVVDKLPAGEAVKDDDKFSALLIDKKEISESVIKHGHGLETDRQVKMETKTSEETDKIHFKAEKIEVPIDEENRLNLSGGEKKPAKGVAPGVKISELMTAALEDKGETRKSETVNRSIVSGKTLDQKAGSGDENKSGLVGGLETLQKAQGEKDGIKFQGSGEVGATTVSTDSTASLDLSSGNGREGGFDSHLANSFSTGQAGEGSEIGTKQGESRFGESVIFNQIVDKFQAFSSNGSVRSVRMQLHPDFLGEVEVRLTVRSGSLVAQFNVENTVVKDVLNSSIDNLRQSLADAGIEVGSLEVNVSQGGLSWHQEQRNGFMKDGSHKKGTISIEDIQEIEAGLGGQETDLPLEVRLAIHGGRLDLVA